MIDAAGWYDGARKTLAHPGRIGAEIQPETVVVHTTDCMPGTMSTIVKSWTGQPGKGDCATFMIGATPQDGVVQFCPISRNSNHAGGWPKHGWLVAPHPVAPKFGPEHFHPNTLAVGIELDNAGYLGRPVTGKWIHPDTKREISAADVQVDDRGRGWHRVTQYQYDQLHAMLTDLRAHIKPPRPGLRVIPNGTYTANGVPWAELRGTPSIVGHVTLDPTQKTDPGPFVLQWLRAAFPEISSSRP